MDRQGSLHDDPLAITRDTPIRTLQRVRTDGLLAKGAEDPFPNRSVMDMSRLEFGPGRVDPWGVLAGELSMYQSCHENLEVARELTTKHARHSSKSETSSSRAVRGRM